MKRVAAFVVAIAIFSALYFSFAFRLPASDNRQLLSLIMGGLSAVHYSPRPVDDSFSQKIFTEFIKRVDFNKKIFTQKDIDQLSQYKNSIDNELTDSSYEFFDAVMKIYSQRNEQAYRYSKLALDKPFDFSADESIETNSDKLSFAPDTIALKNEWRKYMKLQVLQELYTSSNAQEKAKAKSDTVKLKSFTQMEELARTKVKKNNEDFWDRVHDLEMNDWVAAYLNCISNIEDPHTEYFAPVEKQNFDIQTSGQLEGIGAQLQQKDGEIKVSSIVAGSASWKQGQLKAGDVILKVAQGDKEPVSIEGMRLDKAIQLIRGKKGTEVRLTVRKPDGSLLVIPIIRDVVILEATFAQSLIINSNGKKIGYIRLPEFYGPSANQRGGRSCADDMRKELLKLEAENVSGIILDLRDNGGGLLQEAVKLGGLFIKSGPLVQVRSRSGSSNVMNDNDPDVVYSGPLTVMVNENSASASEIVAAALQDYNRGVIIGSNSTYGKGTVQNFFNLDDFVSHAQNTPSLGSLKVTIQKYYRVSGGSTQLRGVTPDIILPDPYAQIPYGEKEDDYALGWDEIAPAKYEQWSLTNNIFDLKSHSDKRVISNPAFQLIQQEADDFRQRNENTSYSLNYKKFSAWQKELDDRQKKYEAITADSSLVNVSNLPVDLSKINSDSTAIARNDQFTKRLKKDIYLNEAALVVGEMK